MSEKSTKTNRHDMSSYGNNKTTINYNVQPVEMQIYADSKGRVARGGSTENDEPSKCRGENAGHEIAGHKE